MIHEKALRKWKSFLQSFFVWIKFPVRHGGIGSQLNRKRFVKSFLSGMRLWCIISTGNYWRKVSCPACEQCASSQQETIGEKFPVRHEAMVHHLNRKRLAKSFLSGMGAMVHHLNRKRFAKGFLCGMGELGVTSTGNYWRTVSCPACEQCVSTQQETMGKQFPVRHGEIGFIATGNYWRIVSCPACEQWESSQQETICRPFPVRHGAMFAISIGNY